MTHIRTDVYEGYVVDVTTLFARIYDGDGNCVKEFAFPFEPKAPELWIEMQIRDEQAKRESSLETELATLRVRVAELEGALFQVTNGITGLEALSALVHDFFTTYDEAKDEDPDATKLMHWYSEKAIIALRKESTDGNH